MPVIAVQVFWRDACDVPRWSTSAVGFTMVFW
jgi:hypothetical protein